VFPQPDQCWGFAANAFHGSVEFHCHQRKLLSLLSNHQTIPRGLNFEEAQLIDSSYKARLNRDTFVESGDIPDTLTRSMRRNYTIEYAYNISA